ncbi:hypothetical protein Tco_1024400 [Tanacetum coccineum]
MSSDSAVTYTSVHYEARSWSIPSEDPYEEVARQLLGDHVTAEDEAPTPPLPPSFLSPRIQPPHTRAAMRTLKARITVLETEALRHEWQRQDADDHAVKHIMRTQTLEARARMDTLEDTGSSS